MSNEYGLTAVAAARLAIAGIPPRDAWKKAITEYYQPGSSSAEKSCPMDTFLGLCEEGIIIGVEKGDYTNSKKNKQYGLEALSNIKTNPALADNIVKLWKSIPDAPPSRNGQMNVVISLWKESLIQERS